MRATKEFVDKLNNQYLEKGAKRILDALEFASEKHEGQKRDSGEDYITHPYQVANILVDMSADEETVIAGLLHDVLEDTETTETEIKNKFGQEVLSLLIGLRKLNNIKRSYYKSNNDNEQLRKMFLAMGSDARIVFVKLADRLHNMQTLEFKTREKQERIAKETLDIYVPLAERLGMYIFKRNMEDLCFKFLYPDKYKEVNDYLDEYYLKSEKYIEDITSSIKQMAKKTNVEARIQSRRKSSYSVFLKWQKKGKEIYDIVALRIICKSIEDCYSMLAEVIGKWKIIDGRVKDYIAHPKQNFYMSLHATLIYPVENGKDIPFEIQIRTEQMHSFCEYGVAAHWIYKEKGIKALSGGQAKEMRRELFKSGELSKDEGGEQYIGNIKQGYYNDKIFVFTPQLKVVELPKGSITIDFAYAIHTGIGNRCVGAKVNDKIVPLTTTLKTGDVVEIITSVASKGPSRDWLKIVKSSDAISSIRAFFKKEKREENIRLGKSMLEEFAKRNGFPLARLLDEKQAVAEIEKKYNLDGEDDIFAAVGYGRLNCSQVLYKIITSLKQEEKQQRTIQKKSQGKTGNGVVIGGYKDLLKKFAKCCMPIPGDEIVGYVSRGKGVTIHRKDCPHLCFLEDERKIDTQWEIQNENELYNTTFNVIASGTVNIITSLTSKIGDMKIDITSISVDKTKSGDTHYFVAVRVKSKRQLIDLMSKLQALSYVYDVFR